jgi:hypothetical protein
MSPYLHVLMSPCQHVSMSPRLHVSMSQCLHVSMSPCLHVPMSHVPMSSHLHISTSPCLFNSMSPCLHSITPRFWNSANGKYRTNEKQLLFVFSKLKTEIVNFRLFAANRNGKRTFVSLVDKQLMVIDDCCSSKHAYLWI